MTISRTIPTHPSGRPAGAPFRTTDRERVRAPGLRIARQPHRDREPAWRIRPLQPDEEHLLVEVFDQMGPDSRFARFLAPKRALTAYDRRHLMAVDHHDHEALVALAGDGTPIGVARFVRDRGEPTSADVAVEVVDAWQDRGVGSVLAARLAERARAEGITTVTALTTSGNARSARLLGKVGTVAEVTRESGTATYRVLLSSPPTRAPAGPRTGVEAEQGVAPGGGG